MHSYIVLAELNQFINEKLRLNKSKDYQTALNEVLSYTKILETKVKKEEAEVFGHFSMKDY